MVDSPAVQEYKRLVSGRINREMRAHIDGGHTDAFCMLCDPDNETCTRCGRVFVHDFFLKCPKGGEHQGDGVRVVPVALQESS